LLITLFYVISFEATNLQNTKGKYSNNKFQIPKKLKSIEKINPKFQKQSFGIWDFYYLKS